MRIALGVLLVNAARWPLGVTGSCWMSLIPWGLSVLLCIGLLTPITAVLCMLFVLRVWLGEVSSMLVFPLCLLLEALALALLGPGAYSLDARLFGRRRIIFSQRHGPDSE